MKEPKRILNNDIKASHVKLIDEAWEILWEMSLQDAKAKAKELSLDLMQLSSNGDLTVVKMLDFWKFLYKQKKQNQKNKQRTKAPELKTIKISVKIWEHDLEIRKNQMIKFSEAKNPVKVILTLKWRENNYAHLAKEKMDFFIEMVQDYYKIDNRVTKQWNNFIAMLNPK